MRTRLRVAVGALAVLAACSSQQRANTETGIAKVLISDEQEAQIGEQVNQELAKQGTRYVTDPVIVDYVTGVANRIFANARKERPGVDFRVQVIDDPKTVNAFAVPGGRLYVYTGLLLAADSEAELAGVWGHEAGHVVARHSARQMVNQYGLEAVTAIALGNNPGVVAQLGAAIVGNGFMLKNSRDDEDEADVYGTRYASMSGYDPHGIAQFFSKLQAQEGKTPSVMTYLSTHPASADRAERVNRYIAEHNLQGSERGDGRLDPIKARLRGQAAPPPAPSAPPPAPALSPAHGGTPSRPGSAPPPASAPAPAAPAGAPAPPSRPSAPPSRPRG